MFFIVTNNCLKFRPLQGMIQQKKSSWLQRSKNELKSTLVSIETWRSASSEFIATFLLFFVMCVSSINSKIDG